MKMLVVLLLLASFLAAPVASICAEPFCDVALESGKFIDWLVCIAFAMIIGDWQGDNYGNGVVGD
jgi:hypothetical protein